jgi:hypothetical protein
MWHASDFGLKMLKEQHAGLAFHIPSHLKPTFEHQLKQDTLCVETGR